MGTADTPDYLRGDVSPNRLLGTFSGSTITATVALPSNAVALWLFVGPPPGTPSVDVVGTSTGTDYPAFSFPINLSTAANQPILVAVAPDIDDAVRITWGSDPDSQWYVVADTGPRIVLDAVLAGSSAEPGTVTPGNAVLVAGSDGTDLRALKTDNTGALITSGGSFPAVYGAPGSATPADALLVGGTDGADLRALSVNSTGSLAVLDGKVALVIQVPGLADPGWALQVGGTDGTDIRALLMDTVGHPLTIDQTLKLCVAVLGAALPADAVLSGGSDGTDLRAILTDKRGVQWAGLTAPDTLTGDHPPVELLSIGGNNNNGSVLLLPAAGAGKRYRIFSATVGPVTTAQAAGLYDSITGTYFLFAQNNHVAQSYLPSGYALTTNAGVGLATSAGNGTFSICYTLETV